MKANSPKEAAKPSSSIDHSKRSFAKLGGVLSPVMLTLANKPAWGRVADLCTQSGINSYDPSMTGGSLTGYVYKRRDLTSFPYSTDDEHDDHDEHDEHDDRKRYDSHDSERDYLSESEKLSRWQDWAGENELNPNLFDSSSDWETFFNNCNRSSSWGDEDDHHDSEHDDHH